LPKKLPTKFLIFCLEPEIFDVKDAKMTKKETFLKHICLFDDKKEIF